MHRLLRQSFGTVVGLPSAPTMFTIVISEKGGAERRETFDKNEVNFGRLQGNDLMLPKGNVSKHHARLLYRDGRFIVTDLRSTNGTYVNGRKISQATIVREGDKIYVGDFVLRLETGQRTPSDTAQRAVEEAPGLEADAPPAMAPPAVRIPLPPPLPVPALVSQAGAPGTALASGLPSTPRLSEPDAAPPFVLDRRHEEGVSASEPRAGAAPAWEEASAQPPEPRGPRGTAMMGDRDALPRAASGVAAIASRASPRSVPPPPPAVRPAPRETAPQAARRLALVTLVDRVADAIDLAPLGESAVVPPGLSQAIERTVREQSKAMRREGEAPEGIDLDLLAGEALRELVGLGPLGNLLEDDETAEVHVVRPDHVLATRGGHTVAVDPAFTSEEALARVIARLAHQSGTPLRPGEVIIDRRLPRGLVMTAIAPPAASGWVLSVRKRRRVDISLADLVRSGAMSESIATFLETSAAVRANVLVVGSGAGAVAAMLGAIASAARPLERVVLLQHGADDLALPEAHVIPLALGEHGARDEQAVYAAARLGADRLIVTSFGGAVASATLDVIAEGCEAVLAGMAAPSLRHALGRLVSQVALARGGTSLEAAREAVGESFDLAVEAERTDSGRLQVKRVVEFEGSDARGVVTRDLFVLSTNGVGDPSYRATGVSPRIAQDFGARGAKAR